MRFIPILAVLAIALVGCGDGNDTKADQTRDQREYRAKVYDQVDMLKQEMAEVGEELKTANEESREALHERHENLEEAAHDLQNHLQFLGNSTESTWEDWKREADMKLDKAAKLLS